MAPEPRESPSWLVGIDLGTTHTVVAEASLLGDPLIRPFSIEQLVGPGEVDLRPLLPSVRYQALKEEVSEGDVQLPWPQDEGDPHHVPIIGEWARQLGAKSKGRLITSAKSWLSHPSADRTAAILPWGSAEEIPKISPVEVSRGFLKHVVSAWERAHPGSFLKDQEIILTVPASFDEAARNLTMEAARQAGLKELKLLEEPQAVCYHWLWRERHAIKTRLAHRRLILVIDIGGGTMDLTLIRVKQEGGEPQLTRVAVGNHLMLGGDNIDLALAQLSERRLTSEGHRLDSGELSQWVEQCRLAKERLLSPDAPAEVKVTLLGSGSRLIGGTRSVTLTRDEVMDLVFGGFFPVVDLDDQPERKRGGVVEFGLPYVADPSMTRHLAAFLKSHREVAYEALGSERGEPLPDLLLLNGGVFNSPLITQRILQQFAHWGAGLIDLLENPSPDLAVAAGAVAYGMARRDLGVARIVSGAPRSLFLALPEAMGTVGQALCLLPRGTEEGLEIVLEARTFLLRLGVPVRFNLLSARDDSQPLPGSLLPLREGVFDPLPPLMVQLDLTADSAILEREVRLVASLSAVGTLDLHCVATNDVNARWQIAFELRQPSQGMPLMLEEASEPRLPEALSIIQEFFGRKSKEIDPKRVKGMRSELEKILGPRADWTMGVLRSLFDVLMEGLSHRRRSMDHERVWLNLAGFCLRPGYGSAGDEGRAQQIFELYPQGPQFVNESQHWSEWWTLWRRIAGGLTEAQQLMIYGDLVPFIDPVSARRGNTPALLKKRAYDDMLRLVGGLERWPVKTKIETAKWLLKRLEKAGEPLPIWWALGRLCARVPAYGSAHQVIPADIVVPWLDRLMKENLKKNPDVALAMTLMARMSGDRHRDIPLEQRLRVVTALKAARSPESWVGLIEALIELEAADQQRLMGDALPPGLSLLQSPSRDPA
jgi:molecular chaperone DnaK (HSP70)